MLDKPVVQRLLTKFEFSEKPPEILVKSPGRANIIGEHTDYNQGLVLPFAIDQAIYFFISANRSNTLKIYAADLDEYKEIELENLSYQVTGWSRYFINAMLSLGEYENFGMDIVFGGDLPSGGGISSSSALSCGFLSGVNHLFGLELSMHRIISLASEAENGIGLNGGLMDQTVICKGINDHALKIDFLTDEEEQIPIDLGTHTFYLFNSGQKHELVDSAYNQRRETCKVALEILNESFPSIKSYRDVESVETLKILKGDNYKRALHVFHENKRVGQAIESIKNKDFVQLGKLINESHVSLSKLYEVSTQEIDALVEISNQHEGNLGARIMGGGFGGCTINLYDKPLEDKAMEEILDEYREVTGLEGSIFKVEPSDGVKVIYL